MKTVLLILLSLSSFTCFSQTKLDKISKLSGETIEAEIKKVTETDIEYVFPGEDVVQVISKRKVAFVIYKSGREEKLSTKIEVIGEQDWQKVSLTNVESEIAGLTKVAEVVGKQSTPYGGQTKLRDKATEKIKREAAKLGAHVVFLQSDKFAMTPINTVTLNGVAYKY